MTKLRKNTSKKASSPNRSQVVYFRLSADEYEIVCRACQASGSQNISAFARSAVWTHVMRSRATGDEIGWLHSKFAELELALEEFLRKRLPEPPAEQCNQK
jgi:hypothetical protein